MSNACPKPRRLPGSCYNCGKMGHFSNKCDVPKQANNPPVRPAQLNAVVFGKPVMEGTLVVYSTNARILFDTGTSDFFICSTFIATLGLVPSTLDEFLW